MAADVLLNGQALLAATDQFMRYIVALPPGALRAAGNNTLSVTFTAPGDARNRRFSGASGGWDWGALTPSKTPWNKVGGDGGQMTLSKGIWRDVYLAAGATLIEHVSPMIFYEGAYPTEMLDEASAGPWRVAVKIILRAATGGLRGELAVAGAWPGAARAACRSCWRPAKMWRCSTSLPRAARRRCGGRTASELRSSRALM